MILYLLALPLFVVALGDDPRCREKYFVDDYCDSVPGERDVLYTYDEETQRCVPTESCGLESSKKLFSTKDECITICNVKGQEIEDVEVPLEDRQIEKERK
ncbi:hypothetical protein V5799_027814 [Amblyomma americanum]|uniref:Secreted protein n=1 Tax=Amblyomma americanum TaxID=6943 RepID=A0AAQ4DEM8_AMBAM